MFEVELLETSDVELKLDFAINFSAHLRHMTANSKFSFGFKVLLVSSFLATELSNTIGEYVKSDCTTFFA